MFIFVRRILCLWTSSR